MSSLFLTSGSGTYEEFLRLYEPGLATSWDGGEGRTLLHRALGNGDLAARAAIAKRLLDDGADAAALSGREKFTTLHILFGNVKHDFAAEAPLLQRLLDGGADINAVAGHRWGTPIQTLAAMGKFSDTQLAPFYDVIFARPDLDLLTPGKQGRSTLDSARLFGPRRADLLVRMEDYLRGQGREVPGDLRE